MNAIVNYKRGDVRCRRMQHGVRCRARQSEHVDGVCPRFGKDFVRANKTRISLSLNGEQVTVLTEIISMIEINLQMTKYRHDKNFEGLAKVVHRTSLRVAERRRSR
jgi:hypothetical protein